MEQKSMSDVLSRLTVLLRNHRDQLVQDWSVRVRKDPKLVRACEDPVRMAQVVSNIIGNALGHSPPDTPVSVELRNENDRVVLQVNNKGAPISPEEIATVFEPFRCGTQDPPTTNRSEGLGLGLYIAKEIVKAHGGTIELTSNQHEGTTVTIILPMRT
jgi:sigma-B regulation protein RsbU (phosphoserine phosphatase)